MILSSFRTPAPLASSTPRGPGGLSPEKTKTPQLPGGNSRRNPQSVPEGPSPVNPDRWARFGGSFSGLVFVLSHPLRYDPGASSELPGQTPPGTMEYSRRPRECKGRENPRFRPRLRTPHPGKGRFRGPRPRVDTRGRPRPSHRPPVARQRLPRPQERRPDPPSHPPPPLPGTAH